jgi:N-acetyl-anhydromuramyl-L-alanine amidase AmpD
MASKKNPISFFRIFLSSLFFFRAVIFFALSVLTFFEIFFNLYLMKFDQLPQIEANFKSQNASQLIPFTAKVANENLTLNGLLYTPPRTNYYYLTAHPKKRIVLHFTAGNLRSDMMSLTTQDRHVSVAFVVARDGTIYQLHPSKGWSGHIGKGIGQVGKVRADGKVPKNLQDKASIGIELSNYAYLVPQHAQLETIYSRIKNPKTGVIGPVDAYCRIDQTNAFRKLDTAFREQVYFASYTPEQMESTIILLRFLTAKYNIPRAFPAVDKRYSTFDEVVNFNGIVSHINFRKTGKWDIGPAFDWDTLINGVTAPTFEPVFQPAAPPATRSARGRNANGTTTTAKRAITESKIDDVFKRNGGRAHRVKSEKVIGDNEGYNPNHFE